MADAITIKALQDASLDAKSLEEVVNGGDAKQVTTRLGETYPSVKKAIKTLFENGGLPATPFATKALMTASALIDGDYAQVTDETANNGLYVKTAGVWVKASYDPVKTSKEYTDTAFDMTITEIQKSSVIDESKTLAHVFTDNDGRVLASIDDSGEFDLQANEKTKNNINAVKKDDFSDYVYVLLDAENKILDGIDKNGKRIYDNDSSANELVPITPLSDIADTVTIKSLQPVTRKLSVNTIAKGRSSDPDITLTGEGLTHPKMVYYPQGWNGYKYWLAATPTFGVINNDAYENPHVWASNDMVTWIEPSGGRIDYPEDGNASYWSDTHLVIDDDGWMYCVYRGNGFTLGGRYIVAKRSRDGVNWSDRIIIYNSDTDGGYNNGLYSPAIYKHGGRWQYIDVLQEGGDIVFTSNYGAGVFRRASNEVAGKYEPYTADKLVNYIKAWGDGQQVWHIDALSVGNLHLHLIAVGAKGTSISSELYLAYSSDGWNYKALPKLNLLKDDIYRSSMSVKRATKDQVELDLIVARTTDGTLDHFTMTLEVN